MWRSAARKSAAIRAANGQNVALLRTIGGPARKTMQCLPRRAAEGVRRANVQIHFDFRGGACSVDLVAGGRPHWKHKLWECDLADDEQHLDEHLDSDDDLRWRKSLRRRGLRGPNPGASGASVEVRPSLPKVTNPRLFSVRNHQGRSRGRRSRLAEPEIAPRIEAISWLRLNHRTRRNIIRAVWRRERDSNPRYGFPYTHFPGVRLQPLGHPSAFFAKRLDGRPFQPPRREVPAPRRIAKERAL